MAKISEQDRETLTAYLDGELDDEASQDLESRLGREPDLRAELEAMRQAWGLLDYLPRAQPSPSFTERTMSRLSLEKMPSVSSSRPIVPARSTPWRTRSVIAAAVVFAVIGGFAAGAWWRPRAPDDANDPIVRHLRILEHFHEYEWAEDLEFLRSLDRPELFGSGTGI